MGRGELIRRAQAVWGFALLLLACVAAPVLAEPAAVESPQAAAEREDSEYAYADLTPAEEEDLLREHFAPQLEAIAADPARALDEVVINRVDSPTEALVTLDGQKLLLESEVPLRAPEEDGDLHKVELELEETASGFEPVNPIVDLALPDSADEPIEVGDHGLKITPLGTSDAPASPLGEEDLFLPAAREDTSFLLSPIAGGVEISALLASRNSPQQLAFEVGLPQGATLRPDGSGGAEALDAQGEAIAAITAPYAIDAQGSEVPVALALEGSTLTLSVPHRDLDVAYPLFVDPEITEQFADGSRFGYWKWTWSGVGPEDFIGRTSCIWTCWSGNGLYLRARSNFSYPAGSWGRFSFTPQGSTTFMRRVILGPINYDTHGCMANEPHAYVGVWNDYSGWSVLANAYPSGWGSYIDTGSQNLGPGTRTAFAGMHAGTAANLSCGRDYRLGGATLFLDDPENPTAGAPWGHPTGWIKDGAAFTINGPLSDPGLGVKKGFLHLGGSVTLTREHACTGYYANPCFAGHAFQFALGADSLDEGEKPLKFSGEDILGKPSNTYEWQVKVDRTPPQIDLGGQLAIATDETESDDKDNKDQALSLPVYKLQINATDGKNPAAGAIAPGEKRSGVKKIEVFLNARTTPEATYEASSCAAGNCPLSKAFTLKLNELEAGKKHTLKVLARDFAGNAPKERKIEFEFIPATGIKEEYVMQYFPLPDGSGNEAEEEHPRRPELAVNLVNGNLVYRQKDVEVETASADLDVELYYNSLLPESQNTEWGDGWTMAEEPALEIEEPGAPGTPTEGTIVEESGAVESTVDLPTAVGASEFDERIQATVTKEADGGFEVTDESGETGESLEFSPSGRLEEVENGTSAIVDYGYEEGALAEIAIEDPGTASVPPGSLEEEEVFPDLELWHGVNLGALGSEDGQFKSPSDVAADAQGNLYVLDRGNGRVQKLSPDGKFISKFGSPGSGPGQLNGAVALALDGDGNLWVLDSTRVQKFGPGGQFLSAFGGGQLVSPRAVAVGIDGTIWVSDERWIQRFTPAGQLIERVGPEWSLAQGLDTDDEGNVYAPLLAHRHIAVYDKDGDPVRQFGAGGTGPGQFTSPVELDVDPDGNVWVADSDRDDVQLFNSAGDFVAGFGSTGSGAQQFKFAYETGIVSDGKGRVWIADAGNHRLSRWVSSSFTDFLHSADFGAFGSEDGQLKSPADVAADAQGNLYVLDRGNGRVQKLGPDGEFISKFAGPGSGPGQLNGATALALDGEGNVWVADSTRVQKFGPSGQFLSAFGGGQLVSPRAVAVGIDGTIWVSDERWIQRFTPAGQLIERVGPEWSMAQGLDTDDKGDVYAPLLGEKRIAVYDKNGDLVRKFGSSGTGPGQLSGPAEVDVDPEGNVWVADANRDDVQLFTSAGDFIAGFGSPGSGAEQFKFGYEAGVVADGKGRIWIADAGNHRIAEWIGGNYDAPSGPVPAEDDPQLEIDVSEGLVDTVEGEEAGTVDYDHSGDLLTSVEGPETGADFTYDEKERLSKVTLANGTYATIAYAPTYNRVSSVTVAPQGVNPKTTSFTYSDEPRRTTVVAPGAPIATYDFAADGSVFKWWSSAQPPVFDDIAGSLYDPANRETAQPIPTGAHTLNVQAYSAEGIASIQIVANNNQLVDEKTCTFDPAVPNSCATVSSEWVTETGNWPPGILHIEVIATDRLGRSSSQRFWVNIPYTPPADPEAEEAPQFGDVLSFREERGLDLDLAGDEAAINDRVFDLIGAWHNPDTPAGQVARATYARWGVPLSAVDAAELEYRLAYAAQSVSAIPGWAAAHASSTYAGYYIDERAGGLIYVGFTGGQGSQAAQVKALADAEGLLAPNRLRAFAIPPAHSLNYLTSLQKEINSGPGSSYPSLITDVAVDIEANSVVVGASDVEQATSLLDQAVGVDAPVSIRYRAAPSPRRAGRERAEGSMRAGDWIIQQDRGTHSEAGECTAGFGAWDRARSKTTGALQYAIFVLSANHCVWAPHEVMRRSDPSGTKKQWIGRVKREGAAKPGGLIVDAAAIRLKDPNLVPRKIVTKEKLPRIPVTGVTVVPPVGTEVCFTGIKSQRERCGPILGPPQERRLGDFIVAEMCLDEYIPGGDSGGPAWIRGTGSAVGIVVSGHDAREVAEGRGSKEACFAPLLPYPGWEAASGVLTNAGMAPLQLVKSR